MEDPFLPALLSRFLGGGSSNIGHGSGAPPNTVDTMEFDADLFDDLAMDAADLSLVFDSVHADALHGASSHAAPKTARQDLLPRSMPDNDHPLPLDASALGFGGQGLDLSTLPSGQHSLPSFMADEGMYLHQMPPPPQASQLPQPPAAPAAKQSQSQPAAKPKARPRKRSKAATESDALTDGPATKVAPRTTAAATATNAATANTSIPDGTPLEPSAGGHSGTASPSVESQGDGRTYVEKRRAHNAVERRYRNSINDRITELRSNLPLNWITGPKAKTSKAAVLVKGIQFIQELKSRNDRLEDENRRLREFMRAHNVNPDSVTPAAAMPTTSRPDETEAPTAARAGSAAATTVSSDAGSSPREDSGLSSAPSSRSNSPNNTFADATRLLMCMALFGVCILAAPGGDGSAPAMASAGGSMGSHGTARVLTSTESSGSTGSYLLSAALWWGWRLMTALACLVAMFMREPLSDTDTDMAKVAADHEKKAVTSVTLGHYPTAKYHAIKALECLGIGMPSTSWRLVLAVAWQGLRQTLHRAQIGLLLDSYFTRRTADHQSAAASAAHAAHVLHQMLLAEGSASASMPVLLCALRAINAAEAAGPSALDAPTLARIYVAAAAQAQLTGAARDGGGGRLLDRFYLHRATAVLSETERNGAGSIGWALTPAGRRFILGGTWAVAELRDGRGQVRPVGSLAQLGLAYRAHTLKLALGEFLRGGDVSLVGGYLQALQQVADEAGDGSALWWAMAGQTALHWRLGQPAAARQALVSLERLSRHRRDGTQRAVYAALRAHQALIDGDTALCVSLLTQASAATALALADHTPPRLPADLHALCQFLALRQVLSTRVALYRLRSYLVAVGASKGSEELTGATGTSANTSAEGDDSDGGDSGCEADSFDAMLEALQADLGMLRSFSEEHTVAEPLALVYRAVCRSLAGGRTAPTQQLFNLASKAARREGLPYDEGLALLHMSACLRGTLSPAALQRNLCSAAALFERLDAADELTSARKMLKLAAV